MTATSDAPRSSIRSPVDKTPAGTEPAGTEPAALTSTIELADELRLTVGRLARRIRQQSTLGLTPSQYSALVSVDQLQPVRLGDLAAAEGVSAPTVTKVVNLLEVAGLVEREVDASDRRSSFVRLTPAGRESLSRIRTERTAFLRQRLDELSPAQRALLVKALPALAALAEPGAR
jgi:DNA-binding MarR family transcriptional regulator